MSFQGTIEANCLSCTDGFEAPIWSFVHGGKDALLRDQAKAMECNLLLCPSCGAAFVPEAAWIYYEPEDEILAFVFPMAFKAEETKWRDKMKADFAAMREALGDHLPVGHEPEVFFGPEGLPAEPVEPSASGGSPVWRVNRRPFTMGDAFVTVPVEFFLRALG